MQPKGLLATEAFVTIPFAGKHPVAIRTHFYEFIDDRGKIFRTGELREGEIYEVVVTTTGGLWRYRMQDRVQVTGFLNRTPTLKFIGRIGNISDLCGEKLSEPFVAEAIQSVFAASPSKPRFAMLAPAQNATGWHYTLYVEGEVYPDTVEALDQILCQNPNYNHCRDLGQLQPVELFRIKKQGYESFIKKLATEGKRIGDIKPTALSRNPGWSKAFLAID